MNTNIKLEIQKTNLEGPVRNGSLKNNRVNPIQKMEIVTSEKKIQNNQRHKSYFKFQDQAIVYSLYVFNLCEETNEEDLWRIFGPFGPIQKISIIKDPETDLSRGFAFVDMKKLDDANLAIEILNGQELNSKILRVNLKGPKNEDEQGLGETGAYQLYIYNVPNDTNEVTLFKLFGQFGGIKNVAIIRDQKKGSKGIAFVTMRNKEEALIAIKTLNGFSLDNSILQVRFKNQKGDPVENMDDSNNSKSEIQLYINNLDNLIEDQVIWKLFAQFGAIKDVNVMRNSNDMCIGYGFVTMKDIDAANLAINTLNDTILCGRKLNVSFKTKKQKDDRFRKNTNSMQI